MYANEVRGNNYVCRKSLIPNHFCRYSSIAHFADTAAILNSIVSNIYYGMIWGQFALSSCHKIAVIFGLIAAVVRPEIR